jgi:hypothetical protein
MVDAMPRAGHFEVEGSLRPADEVMQLRRLGSMHQSRLSFARSLVRQMIRERWRIERERFRLDAAGNGEAIYRIDTPEGCFRFVIFASELDEARRSDRVIADAWDTACALCDGDVDEAMLAELRENVPRQEAGRCSARVLTLSRANRSQRNFNAILERLAAGRQPEPEWIAEVGYLYRTTAVYGNGKFGIADYERVCRWRTFSRPFSAQMFTVYMVRHFSIEQIEHMAQARSATAVALARNLARYLGIGNSTGLGMAPFLINHPLLVDRWIEARETALARVRAIPARATDLKRLRGLIRRACQHLQETVTADSSQRQVNAAVRAELGCLSRNLDIPGPSDRLWDRVLDEFCPDFGLETQELIVSLLLELYPSAVNGLEDDMAAAEDDALCPEMPLEALRRLIEQCYGWALDYDFRRPGSRYYFWYRSAEKEEPRLGERDRAQGAGHEMPLDIARQVSDCHAALCAFMEHATAARVVDFLLAEPAQRGVVRRIQTVSACRYGEIRANLIGRDCVPIHLLRCKLSFFGASKFDPRSDRWVRITLFQGAPLADELGGDPEFDWFLPVMPVAS